VPTAGPRIARVGLVVLDPTGTSAQQVITLQYNPDSLNRSLQPRGSTTEAGEVQRVSGPPNQTISFDAELDATDQLESPRDHPVEVADGLHPYLAVLEDLLYPPVADILHNDRLAGQGFLEIVPALAPTVILVWSRNLVTPVRLTELSIIEEAFDARLNPVRAKVSLSCKVLTTADLGARTPVGSIAVGQHTRLETLAGARGFGTLTDLGPGVTL
jgi:hypothetical protein